MAVWLDGVVDDQRWSEQTKRLLIVCPEPNEAWMNLKNDARRDMRQLLRHPEDERKPFYARLRQAIRAFHDVPSRSGRDGSHEHSDLVRKIAFMNLKKTGGGSSADQVEIMVATDERRADLIGQIVSIAPTHIFVAGRQAQAAFRTHIRQHVRHEVSEIPHPSCRLGYHEYYRRVKTAMRCLTTG